jgi:hypothetical protein
MILEAHDKVGSTAALHIADSVHVASGSAKEIAHAKHELVQSFIHSSGIATERLLEARARHESE